jgi:hypothetical protein
MLAQEIAKALNRNDPTSLRTALDVGYQTRANEILDGCHLDTDKPSRVLLRERFCGRSGRQRVLFKRRSKSIQNHWEINSSVGRRPRHIDLFATLAGLNRFPMRMCRLLSLGLWE